MKGRRIISIPDGITWKEFATKYDKFFPISSEAHRIEKLKSEYRRLTGNDPDIEKPARQRRKNEQAKSIHTEAACDNGPEPGRGLFGNSKKE